MTSLNFDVNWRDHGMGRGIDDLNRKIDSLERNLQDLSRTTADPNVQLNISQAERDLAKIKTDLLGLRNIKLQIDADSARARADINNVQRDLERLRAQPATVEVQAKITEAEARIQELKTKLAEIKDLKINADADIAAAKARFEELKATIATIRDVHINADVDAAKATAELAALRAVVKATGNDGNLASKALGGLATAIGSGISSLGSFIGSSTQVGSTLTSLGSSVSGASTSFAGFGQSVGSALSSALPFLATAALWTAMGVAIAAAGSVAVGALGQIGGAAIALASGIVPLVESLGLLPGLFAPAGVAAGVLALAFSNAGEKGLTLKSAMDQLRTAFGPVISQIQSQLQPVIEGFIQSVAGLAPVIQSVLPQITSAMSEAISGFSQILRSSSFQNDLRTILQGAAQNIRVFADAGRSAFLGFTNIVVAAQPAVNRIAQDLDQAAQKFNAWTAAARQSGELTQIFNQVATVLEQIGNTVTNVAGLFLDLWNSANRTGAFTSTLAAINDGITQFRDYVNDAGGAWDQLMSKAGTVTQSIIGLVGAIGNAFVTLGGQMDISGVIDTITQAINNLTPVFAQIGQAAVPAIEDVITIISHLATALGPSVTQAITVFDQTLKGINWSTITTAISLTITGLSDLMTAFQSAGQTVALFTDAMNKIGQGDLSGALRDLQQIGTVWSNFGQQLQNSKAAVDAAAQGGRDLSSALNGVGPAAQSAGQATSQGFQTAQQSITTYSQALENAKTSISQYAATSNQASQAGQAHAQALQNVVNAANMAQTAIAAAGASASTLEANHQRAVSAVQQLGQAMGLTQGQIGQYVAQINAVPTAHGTTFTGDGASLLAAAAGGQQAIQGVVPQWLTQFAGDAANLIGQASQADSAVNTVPSTHGSTFTGDFSGLSAAATNSTAAIGGVPTDHNTLLNADATSALSIVQSAVDAINNIPADHSTSVDVQDNSTGVIDSIINALNSIPTAITSTVTTIYRTITGGAAGYIVTPGAAMAAGGVLAMAPGGRLTPNMSASTARIVGPNTWRVIGDRPVGDEAFIPINRSSRSVGLLGETANRMGFALAPMAAGAVSRRDQQAWKWLEQLLRRHRGGHGGGGGGTGTPPPILDNWGGSAAYDVALGTHLKTSMASLGSGLTAAITRPVTEYARTGGYFPATPSVPMSTSSGGSPATGGSGTPRQVYINSDSALIQQILRMVKAEVRKQGGNVQAVLGSH